jgi:Skp family chaperone for outer membrane proteins
MTQTLPSIAFALVLAVSCVACDKLKPPLPETQKPPTPATAVSTEDAQRKAFAHAAQKELDELTAAITELRVKAKVANAQAQGTLDAEIARVDAQRREVQQLLSDLKATTLDSWVGVKESFGSALERLKAGVAKIRKSAN